MLSVTSVQPSPALVRYDKQFQRPVEIVLPFLKLHSGMRRVYSILKETASFSTSLYGLFDAVRQRDAAGVRRHTVRLAVRAIGIVAAVFAYRMAKIAKDGLDLLKALKDLIRAIPSNDLEKITTLFWTAVLSVLSLGLTLIKSTKLLLALELISLAVSLDRAAQEAKGEKRLPETFAHLAMACVRGYRSLEPLKDLLEPPARMEGQKAAF